MLLYMISVMSKNKFFPSKIFNYVFTWNPVLLAICFTPWSDKKRPAIEASGLFKISLKLFCVQSEKLIPKSGMCYP